MWEAGGIMRLPTASSSARSSRNVRVNCRLSRRDPDRVSYNAAGCVTNVILAGAGCSRSLALTWDGEYRLTAAATNGVEAERNGYDALGRRAWSWDGSETNWFVYNGAQVIADVDSTGGLKRTYLWGPGIDNLLAMTVYTGMTPKAYYAIKDHLGSVLAMADDAGAVVESYESDAWGRVLGVCDATGVPIAESALGNRYLWQGREYSWKTGLYYFRARWYDPVSGRWLSKDSGGVACGLNEYEFCLSNPVNYFDSDGREPTPTSVRVVNRDVVIWYGSTSAEVRSGGTVSWRCHNPLNIVYSPTSVTANQAVGRGPTVVGNDKLSFAVYGSDECGKTAARTLLRHDYSKNTISQMIRTWTKARGLDLKNYRKTVTTKSGLDLTNAVESLSDVQLNSLIDAMSAAEGYRAGTVQTIWTGD